MGNNERFNLSIKFIPHKMWVDGVSDESLSKHSKRIFVKGINKGLQLLSYVE